MELEELKQQMNRQLENNSNWQPPVDLRAIIGKRSANVVQQIRRSLWMEMWMGIFINIPLAIYFGYRYKQLLDLSLTWIIFILIIVTIPALGYLIAKTYWFEKESSSIRENLIHIHLLITRYCQVNLLLAFLAIPMGYGLGLYLTLPSDGSGDLLTFISQMSAAETAIFLVVFIFLEFLFYFLMRKYFQYFYGKYLVKIKEMISELESE
ncbi:MAG: hypothetical protein ACK53B_11330 [Bacteroidota bacterium]